MTTRAKKKRRKGHFSSKRLSYILQQRSHRKILGYMVFVHTKTSSWAFHQRNALVINSRAGMERPAQLFCGDQIIYKLFPALTSFGKSQIWKIIYLGGDGKQTRVRNTGERDCIPVETQGIRKTALQCFSSCIQTLLSE